MEGFSATTFSAQKFSVNIQKAIRDWPPLKWTFAAYHVDWWTEYLQSVVNRTIEDDMIVCETILVSQRPIEFLVAEIVYRDYEHVYIFTDV